MEKLVPRVLTQEKIENSKGICADKLEKLDADHHNIKKKKIIIWVEMWIFPYDPEMKRQSMTKNEYEIQSFWRIGSRRYNIKPSLLTEVLTKLIISAGIIKVQKIHSINNIYCKFKIKIKKIFNEKYFFLKNKKSYIC